VLTAHGNAGLAVNELMELSWGFIRGASCSAETPAGSFWLLRAFQNKWHFLGVQAMPRPCLGGKLEAGTKIMYLFSLNLFLGLIVRTMYSAYPYQGELLRTAVSKDGHVMNGGWYAMNIISWLPAWIAMLYLNVVFFDVYMLTIKKDKRVPSPVLYSRGKLELGILFLCGGVLICFFWIINYFTGDGVGAYSIGTVVFGFLLVPLLFIEALLCIYMGVMGAIREGSWKYLFDITSQKNEHKSLIG